MNTYIKITGKDNILKILLEFETVFPSLKNRVSSIEDYADKLNRFAEVYYAVIDGEIFGLVAFYVNDMQKREGYISLIGIKKNYEHRGLGSSLLRECISLMKEKGMKMVKLEVDNYNKHAFDFYIRNEFRKSGITMNNSIYMSKEI